MTLSSQPPTNFVNVFKDGNITSGGAVLKIGAGYVWIDATGDLRVFTKLDQMPMDLSGAVVGSQS